MSHAVIIILITHFLIHTKLCVIILSLNFYYNPSSSNVVQLGPFLGITLIEYFNFWTWLLDILNIFPGKVFQLIFYGHWAEYY